MGEAKLRIKITADVRIGFTAMFEPLGMAYDLEPGSHMYVKVVAFRGGDNELETIQWPGGISIWAPSAVTTYSADGDGRNSAT